MLCEDPVSMIALHIPEEDRCVDILESIEMDKLLVRVPSSCHFVSSRNFVLSYSRSILTP